MTVKEIGSRDTEKTLLRYESRNICYSAKEIYKAKVEVEHGPLQLHEELQKVSWAQYLFTTAAAYRK